MTRRAIGAACSLALGVGTAAVPASAQIDPHARPEPVVFEKDSVALATPDTFIDPDMHRPWSAAHTRAFASALVDAGYLYLRPRLSLGYGKPFSSWAGVDLNPVLSSTEIAGYAGLHALFGPFDVRGGYRYDFPFDHHYLPQQYAYSRLDLESTVGGRSTYSSMDLEIKGAFRVGPGDVLTIGSLSYIWGVPAGFDVYDEELHTIMQPPLLWWGRGGYEIRLGSQHQHGVAIVSDVLYSPSRQDTVVRAGLLLHFAFSHHFELRGSFVPTIYSRDGIGLAGDDFTELGVRYRWATGD